MRSPRRRVERGYNRPPTPTSAVVCFNCNGVGHVAKQCPSPQRRGGEGSADGADNAPSRVQEDAAERKKREISEPPAAERHAHLQIVWLQPLLFTVYRHVLCLVNHVLP
ncbi:unnamed protein product, partial [Cylicocyclus nassatus]